MTLAKRSESEKITKCIPHYLIYYKRCSLLVAAAFATTLAVAILAVAAAVVAATRAAATFAADHLSHLGNLLSSSLAVLENLTAEVELQASQWVVQVAGYLCIADVLHYSIEVVAIFVLQWDDSTNLYVLCIKLAVDGKDLLVELQYALIIVLTVSLLWVQLEVELFTLSQVYHLLFESWQSNAHAADEDERALVGCALDEHLLAVVTISYIIQCV